MKRIALVLSVITAPLAAQWLDYPDARTPRTKDGKPNLTALAPRLNGKIDLSGVWQAQRTPASELSRVLGTQFLNQQVDSNDLTKFGLDIFWGLRPDEEPIQPAAAAVLMQRRTSDPPVTKCLPASVPAGEFVYEFKMIQTPQEIIALSGAGDPARQIYLDGRPLPKDPQPSWMGYSIGKWEGDILVVETTGVTEAAWLDFSGHPRSQSTRLVERYHRRDFGHMDLEVTVEDPKYYTRSVSFKEILNLLPDSDILEFVCAENEKDRAHMAAR